MTTKTIKLYPSPDHPAWEEPMPLNSYIARLQALAAAVPDMDRGSATYADGVVSYEHTMSPREVAEARADSAEEKLKAIRDHLAPHPGDQLPDWLKAILGS